MVRFSRGWIATARKRSRYGHRDATMILIAYRHGLRVSELCRLEWSQIDFASGLLHVARLKGSISTTHPVARRRAVDGGELIILNPALGGLR
jgi:integrase